MILLEENFNLVTNDHRTHKKIEFDLPPDIKRLEIHFSFQPGVVEDRDLLIRKIEEEMDFFSPAKRVLLGKALLTGGVRLTNMISVTLKSPVAFLGCAHRHSENHHIIISQNYASPGFIHNPPIPGKWDLVLSMSSLYQTAKANLRIEGIAI